MYVCVCNAVTEEQVNKAIHNGANTVKQLRDQLGVGADCGSCVSCAKACINAAQTNQDLLTNRLTKVVDKKLIQISPIRLGTA